MILIPRWYVLFPRSDSIETSPGRRQYTSCKTNGYSDDILIDVAITSCFVLRVNISDLCQIIHKWGATYEYENSNSVEPITQQKFTFVYFVLPLYKSVQSSKNILSAMWDGQNYEFMNPGLFVIIHLIPTISSICKMTY